MIFHTFGNTGNPVIVMLAGSFCPAESMELVYSRLKDDYYIIAPTYNGCYKGSKAFTSRQGEAQQICEYLKENNIFSVKMVYGQSMGCEVGVELIKQLIDCGIKVESGFFDGAPCASLSEPMRRVMLFIFRSFINALKGKTIDEAMNIGLIRMMSNKDPEALRSMVESILEIAPYLTDETVRNQVECCYTFDFPKLPSDVEHSMHFFYGKSEKAYKLSFGSVRKAYPNAVYIIKAGYGHCTYMSKNTDDYMSLMRQVMNSSDSR